MFEIRDVQSAERPARASEMDYHISICDCDQPQEEGWAMQRERDKEVDDLLMACSREDDVWAVVAWVARS